MKDTYKVASFIILPQGFCVGVHFSIGANVVVGAKHSASAAYSTPSYIRMLRPGWQPSLRLSMPKRAFGCRNRGEAFENAGEFVGLRSRMLRLYR